MEAAWIDKIETQYMKLEGKMDDLQTEVAECSTQLAVMNERMGSIIESLEAGKEKFKDYEVRIRALEQFRDVTTGKLLAAAMVTSAVLSAAVALLVRFI